MIEHPGEKLENVPSSDRLSAGVLTPGPGAADNLAGGFVPLDALEHKRATDAVAAEANGHEAFFHRCSSVHREAAEPPAQHVSDNDFGDLAACHEQPQDLRVEELLDLDGVEGQKVPEVADRQPAAIGQQDVEVRMPAQRLAGSLKEAGRTRDDLLAAESSRIVELEDSPRAAGRLTEEPAVEAEEDRSRLGTVKTTCRRGASARSALAHSTQSSSHFWWHDGQRQRSLPKKAIRTSCPHSAQCARAAPWAKMPQSR